MATTQPLITRSDDVAWGTPVFAGTRVPVDTLSEYREASETLEEFPTVTREHALAVLEAGLAEDARRCQAGPISSAA